MAAALLQQKGDSENIAAIVVGADRVAANGDTANKIGTYALAILARFHGVKFLVAAPRTTVDLGTESGASIKIEERPPNEMTRLKGPAFDNSIEGEEFLKSHSTEEISIAAKGTHAWNPAFDVTPAELIDGIVTENGVVEKNSEGHFQWNAIFNLGNTVANGESKRMSSHADSSLEPESPKSSISWNEALGADPDRVPSFDDWNLLTSGDELALLPKKPIQPLRSNPESNRDQMSSKLDVYNPFPVF